MAEHGWFAGEGGTLEWREIALGKPEGTQVLIETRAAGINRPDLLQRAGLYPPPPGAPEWLGLEAAGVVRETGPDVSRFKPGDRVMALVPGGAYATACLAEEGSVMPIPEPMSFAEAAAFPETAFTVFTNVFEGGRLAAGERLFVHGATSGIGTMAAAVATALGHEIYGTAGSAGKVSAAEKLGFTKVWNYKDQDWSTAMKDLGGCDVLLDMVGGDYVPRNLALLRDGGRHVSIAFQRGMEATVSIVDIMRRRLTLTGSTLRARSTDEKARLRARVEQELFPLIQAGKLSPVIGLEVPMAKAEDAHAAMQQGDLIGKAVLVADA